MRFMNQLRYISVIFVFIISGLLNNAYSIDNWSQNINLTDGTTQAREPKIYSDGKAIHLIYRDRNIMYLQSQDNGKEWTAPVTINPKQPLNSAGTLITERDKIHVVYPSSVNLGDGSYFQLFSTYSSDDGKTWSEPHEVVSTQSQSLSPKLVKLINGIAVVWYEMEEYQVRTKQDLNTKLVKNIAEKPFVGLIPLEEFNIQRFTILFSRSFDEGKSWSAPQNIWETPKPISYFTGYSDENGVVTVIWEEERNKIATSTSRDSGSTWDTIWRNVNKLDPFIVVQTAYGQESPQYVWTNRDLYKQSSIIYRKGINGDQIRLTEPSFMRSPPDIAVDNHDIHVAWAASNDFNSVITYKRTDIVPPISRITEPDSGEIKEPEVTIAWAGTDDISEHILFSYRVGTTEWTQFEPISSITIKSPPDGAYTFHVRALDQAGNVEKPGIVFPFNTYKVAPNTFFAGKIPDVINSREITIAWSGEDNSTSSDMLSYSYRFDDGEWSEFKQVKRHTLDNLLETQHFFEVRAMDEQGNTDASPAKLSFSVYLNIEVNYTIDPPEILNVPEITLSWDAIDNTGIQVPFEFRYSVDGLDWKDWSLTKQITLEKLDSGYHSFSVEAKDPAGNISQRPRVHKFLIDLKAPETFASLIEIDKENQYFPKISITAEDDYTLIEDLNYSYRIGETGEWSSWTRDTEISISQPIKFYSMGYDIHVRSKDEAGNIDQIPAIVSLKLFGGLRYPLWLLYSIIGAIGLFIVGSLFLVIKARFASKPKAKPSDELESTTEIEEVSTSVSSDDDMDFKTDDSVLSDSDDDDDLFS